jgi:hypothetical protein
MANIAEILSGEGWYSSQTIQWEAMEKNGWVFLAPPYIPNSVGIEIRKQGYSATFRVPRSLSPRAIHTELLHYCQTFAGLVDG